MKKNVLYIGNALSNNGKTVTTIETLALQLRDFCSVKIASRKFNKVLRLIDMVNTVISNRKWAEVVLIDTYSTTNYYYALLISQICRILKIKYIPILHGGNLEQRLIKNPYLSKLIFGNAYKLVAPSNFLKSVFKTFGYEDVLHIPNAIEIQNYQFESRAIDDIKLLWVRSFSSIYNPELAILVLESLLKKGHQAELTMVGPEVDGAMQKTKTLAESKNLNVDFTGKLSKKEWVELSRTSNIFINTTNFDNMPVSVIEAMALGLPIVSTNVGGIPFLLTNNIEGLLVAPNDADTLVEAILKIKKDNNLKDTMITNARKKVEQFDWEIVKSKWQSLLS